VGAFCALATLIAQGARASVTANPRALLIFIEVSSPAFCYSSEAPAFSVATDDVRVSSECQKMYDRPSAFWCLLLRLMVLHSTKFGKISSVFLVHCSKKT
jgi:hypothetical protein